MKTVLIYFTGTYNSRYLTNLFKERLTKKGHEVVTLEIQKDTPQMDISGFDLVGFSYPIWAFNSPKIFDKYVKHLNLQKGQKCFIYKQSGETYAMNNASSRYLKKIIKKHDAVLINERHYPMPYNILFRYKDNNVKQILEENDKAIDVQLYEIEHNIVSVLKSKWYYNLGANLLYIQRFGGWLNSFFYHVNRKKCIDCGLCIKTCPVDNVFKNKKGKIKFHHNCLMCMRCSFYCPKDAISIGFLEPFKVNGTYNLDKVKSDSTIKGDYVTKDTKGFFKCYKKTYKEVDELYKKYFEA